MTPQEQDTPCVCGKRQCAIPYGTCHCGCGEKTNLSPCTRHALGLVKGKPLAFARQHHRRLSSNEYLAEDRGYVTPCWIWQRGKSGAGYGQLASSGYSSAHVAYYVRVFGPVPRGMELDHLCRVRACVNPNHLEAVTPAENVRRGERTKLTAAEVTEIVTLLHSGLPQRKIADKYSVSRSHISKINTGNYWANVPRRVSKFQGANKLA